MKKIFPVVVFINFILAVPCISEEPSPPSQNTTRPGVEWIEGDYDPTFTLWFLPLEIRGKTISFPALKCLNNRYRIVDVSEGAERVGNETAAQHPARETYNAYEVIIKIDYLHPQKCEDAKYYHGTYLRISIPQKALSSEGTPCDYIKTFPYHDIDELKADKESNWSKSGLEEYHYSLENNKRCKALSQP